MERLKADRRRQRRPTCVFKSSHALFLSTYLVFSSLSVAADEIPTCAVLQSRRPDIGFAALTLAREIYPELDVRQYSMKIDQLALRVQQEANGATGAERRIRAMNAVIFGEETIRYDHSPDALAKPSNYFMSGILDTKRGNCYTMPLLYTAVAQRAGYPIHLVAAPDHLFARYVDPDLGQFNIEVTSGGKYISDASYIRDFLISDKARQSGSYLRTLGFKETVAHLFGANAFYYASRGRVAEAVKCLKCAIQLDPAYADNHKNLAEIYSALSFHVNPQSASRYGALAAKEAKTAEMLGFVGREDIERIRGGRR